MKPMNIAQAWQRVAHNSRFWILAAGVVLSVNIAGFVQFAIPSGTLQTIRLEQWYGFTSLTLLYLAMLASPLTKAFPRLPGKDAYLHARRAIGVLAFYFAVLHVNLTFFRQLGGFSGIKYLNHIYGLAALCGVFALSVLGLLAATSFDWAVKHMGYKWWKLLQRLVYLAAIAILLHVLLIGPHFAGHLTVLGGITYTAGAFLLVLEARRVTVYIRQRSQPKKGAHD